MKEIQPKFKYEEDVILKEISEYIQGTYSKYYASGAKSIQAFDAVIEIDGKEAWRFFRNCAIKYLWRFGKKEGFNRLDLLKAIHYIILTMFLTKEEK